MFQGGGVTVGFGSWADVGSWKEESVGVWSLCECVSIRFLRSYRFSGRSMDEDQGSYVGGE